jgi:hypothetical protein
VGRRTIGFDPVTRETERTEKAAEVLPPLELAGCPRPSIVIGTAGSKPVECAVMPVRRTSLTLPHGSSLPGGSDNTNCSLVDDHRSGPSNLVVGNVLFGGMHNHAHTSHAELFSTPGKIKGVRRRTSAFQGQRSTIG